MMVGPDEVRHQIEPRKPVLPTQSGASAGSVDFADVNCSAFRILRSGPFGSLNRSQLSLMSAQFTHAGRQYGLGLWTR